MKKIIYIVAIIFCSVLVSCSVKEEKIEKDGKEFVVIDGDTLGVLYENHTVISCERKTPSNIHEEMNIVYDVKLEDGTVFSSRKTYGVGDTITYTIYTK